MYVCSLSYPACNANAPYCHLWPVRLCRIFPHYLKNSTIFKRNLLNIKCVYWFYVHVLSETFLIVRRTERDVIIYVYWSSCIVPVIRVILYWKLFFLDRYSKNSQISNFTTIRPVGAEFFHADGQTNRQRDIHDEANSRFSKFFKRAYKGKAIPIPVWTGP